MIRNRPKSTKITNVYGDDFCFLNNVINWIKKFKNDYYSFKDKLRSDLAPSDFHLFRSMDNQMREEKFENEEELKSWIDSFFASKNKNFYKRGFEKMV